MHLLEISDAMKSTILDILSIVVTLLVPYIGMKLKWHMDKINGTKAALTGAIVAGQVFVETKKKSGNWDDAAKAEARRIWLESTLAAASKGGAAWIASLNQAQLDVLREASVAISKPSP